MFLSNLPAIYRKGTLTKINHQSLHYITPYSPLQVLNLEAFGQFLWTLLHDFTALCYQNLLGVFDNHKILSFHVTETSCGSVNSPYIFIANHIYLYLDFTNMCIVVTIFLGGYLTSKTK